ncbi:MAG: 4-hydroxythreonine-4-phosphate dehydrogenase PdxA [Chloroflexota bacterium]|nr:4-hydroxythreonine-4-phosphate dehydrogenase PdxA [Chloroflexota bacterium]
MSSNTPPLLGITMGDVCGSGPEIVTKALASPEVQDICRPLVIGDSATLRQAYRITNELGQVRVVGSVAEANFEPGVVDVLDLKNIDLAKLTYGQVNPMAGKAAYEYVIKSIELALTGEIEAIVTSALNKEALNMAGYHYAGHTEILRERCGVKDVTMMLVCKDLRVTHVSTHVSLREAIERVKKGRIVRVAKLTRQALLDLGIEEPRLAVAALNPHAGEGGLFGNEEEREIAPAVEELRERGWDATGPVPADSVYWRASQGQFDAVVAMYHDQGHIPIKVLGFLEGVNVTLGLPIIRTSVDHGTNFGKAGKGTADPTSLIEAVKLAVQLVEGRKRGGCNPRLP